MIKKIITLALVLITGITVALPATSSAWTGNLSQGPQGQFTNWDWPYMIQHWGDAAPTGYCTGSCQSYPDFNADTWSYVVMHSTDWGTPLQSTYKNGSPDPTGSNTFTSYKIYAAKYPDKLVIDKDTTTGQYYLHTNGNTPYCLYSDSFVDYDGYNAGSTDHPRYGVADLYQNCYTKDQLANGTKLPDGTWNNHGTFSAMDKYLWMHNVEFGAAYDGSKSYDGVIGYGSKGGANDQKCAVTAVGCWVSKAINGLQDTFAGWFTAIGNFFVTLFVPDPDKVTQTYNTLKTQISAQFGFLLWPAQTLAGIFNAFYKAGSTCSSYSCMYTFGNLFGHQVTINMLAMQQAAPSIWTWFCNLVKGTTVIAILFTIRRKYLETLDGGTKS